jgi:pilus assembly protein CpaF
MFTNRPAIKKETPIHDQNNQTKFSELKNDFFLIRDAVQKNLLTNNNTSMDSDLLRSKIEDCFNQVLEDENILYNHSTRTQMLEWVIEDIIGYGPIEPLLKDPEITEIMVNGYDKVFVERFGLIERTSVKFENDAHLMRVIDRIVSPIGRRVDETSPMVDARLPNGYRVNATVPPLSMDGPILTVRKFRTEIS